MALAKHVLGLTLAAAFVVTAAPARAQTFAEAGTFAVSGERLVGYTWTKSKAEASEGTTDYKVETTRSGFDFLVKGSVEDDPFAAPRIGFDYFVITGLSVGGYFGYSSEHVE